MTLTKYYPGIIFLLGLLIAMLWQMSFAAPVSAAHIGTSTAPTSTIFNIMLRGSDEVPSVTTTTTGQAIFVVTTATSSGTSTIATTTAESIAFQVWVWNGDNITMAHIHCGAVGQNGPVVAPLFGMIHGGFDVHGSLGAFRLTNANITPEGASCSPEIRSINELWHAIDMGRVYVNVHSVNQPGGLIRGQLIGVSSGTSTGTTTIPNYGMGTTTPGMGTTTGTTTAAILDFIQALLADIRASLSDIMNRVTG